jgi:hypothetical protein
MSDNYTTYRIGIQVISGQWGLYLFGYDIRNEGTIIVPCYEVYRYEVYGNGRLANDSVPKHIARRLLRKAMKKTNAVLQQAVQSLYA